MYDNIRRNLNRNIMRLTNAFAKDGYDVKKIVNSYNRVGIMAEHKTAVNYDTGSKKKAYYLEGTEYEMGYLLGLLAEKEISAMARGFTNNVFQEYIGIGASDKRGIIEELLISVMSMLWKDEYSGLPREIRDEMQGIYDGCKKSNPRTGVDMKHLFTLNAGIDILCSLVYTGGFLLRSDPSLKPADFNIPIMCNAFAVFGRAAGNGHYFGRDFMFPTVGVFQDTAAHFIYNPVNTAGRKSLPFVSIAAPGMVGSISAMNLNGVGIGMDMSPGANCNTKKVGVNSILLARICAQYGHSANHAIEIMKETQRGVSWNYILADGRNDKACIVEAGSSNTDADFLKYIPDDFKALLPGRDFLNAHKSTEFQNGLMVRWNDYEYPFEYLQYNSELWRNYNKRNGPGKIMYTDAFYKKGYINKTPTERNCPSTLYFAPQRETEADMVLTTNHYIIPEMRLFAMYPWTSSLLGNKTDDIQWRYDEMNYQILNALETKGVIDYPTARKLIDYLAPYGKHSSYYAGNPRSRDGKEIRIQGCTSLFDLKGLMVESHYGYYCDDWVKTTLPYYFE